MGCRRCGGELYGNKSVCPKCMDDWQAMRKMIWDYCVKKFGGVTRETLADCQKESRRLSRIWRKDKDKFQEIINGGEVKDESNVR